MRRYVLLLDQIEAVQTSVRPKNFAHQRLRRGRFVSVVYYEIEKEHIKLQQFTGRCDARRSGGLNTTFAINSLISKIYIKQMFFLYSRVVLDVSILKQA